MVLLEHNLLLNAFAYIFLFCLFRVNWALPIVSARGPITRSQQPGGNPKFVVAHHIIGNTFNYTASTWLNDVTLAHASGIDAFALNIGNEPWEANQVKSAYNAALASGTNFKMFLSLDMSSLPCASPSDAQNLVALVNSQASHPSQFRYGPQNKAFVSTFSGEACTFSSPSPSQGWAQHFINPLGSNIYFVPSFFVDPSQLATGDAAGNGGFGGIISGDFNWNSGWPIQVTTATLSQSAANPTALASLLNINLSSLVQTLARVSFPGINSHVQLSQALSGLSAAFRSVNSITDSARSVLAAVSGAFTSDQQHLNVIKNVNQNNPKTYMAAVSPWFYTHYSPQSFNKNFLFLSDHHLYSKRWETLVNSRNVVDLVELVSWNDYGESHYLGPIEGIQPNSQAWVDGNDHTGWLALTTYYAQAFKTGVFPTITKDKVVMWARPHTRDAQASADPVAKPTNFQLTEDSLWATVLVPAPSTVVLSVAPPNAAPMSLLSAVNSTTAQVFRVPAGASHIHMPLMVGGGMRAVVIRNNAVVLDFAPKGYTFNSSPKTYNFNAFVAASP